MRKLGGGGFGKVCRDFMDTTPGVTCKFGAACRFMHPGVFQVQSVFQTLPLNWPPVPHVGRLDVATEGLLLFTDDGQLQSALLDKSVKPRAREQEKEKEKAPRVVVEEVKKVYLVQVSTSVSTAASNSATDPSSSVGAVGVSDQAGDASGASHVSNNNGGDPGPKSDARIVTETVLASLAQPLLYEEDQKETQAAVVEAVRGSVLKGMLKCIPAQHRREAHVSQNQADSVGDTTFTKPNTAWVKITIFEGKNRQVSIASTVAVVGIRHKTPSCLTFVYSLAT